MSRVQRKDTLFLQQNKINEELRRLREIVYGKFEEVASALEEVAPIVPIVNALPSSPVDGQEIYFQNAAMASDGVVWHLRYRAASTSFKWEYIGGSELQSGDFPNRTTFNTAAVGTYVDMAQSGVPSPVIVPLTGIYDFRGIINGSTGGTGCIFDSRLGLNGVAFGAAVFAAGGASLPAFTRFSLPIFTSGSLTAGDAMTLMGSTNNIPVNLAYVRTRFSLLPVKVG